MSLRYHKGPFIQRGGGLGNIFGSLFKSVIPVLSRVGKSILRSPTAQSVLKSAKDAAIQGGVNLAVDALRGNDVIDGVQQSVKNARNSIADAIADNMSTKKELAGKKRKSSSKKKMKRFKKKRKINNIDIFDNE
jgi:hypothetical protein